MNVSPAVHAPRVEKEPLGVGPKKIDAAASACRKLRGLKLGKMRRRCDIMLLPANKEFPRGAINSLLRTQRIVLPNRIGRLFAQVVPLILAQTPQKRGNL
jgi:hypothetical protein